MTDDGHTINLGPVTVEPRTWELTYVKKPWTLNAERSGGNRGIGGRYGRAALTREWRETFWGLALEQKVPRLDRIRVTVVQTCKDGRMPDIGACVGAAKAAVDGLVDAGVVPDDSPEHLVGLTFVPPVKTGTDSLTVRVEEA